MKSLLKKRALGNNCLEFQLMLDDEIMPGMKKDEDTQNYILSFKIPKDISIEGFDVVDKAPYVVTYSNYNAIFNCVVLM